MKKIILFLGLWILSIFSVMPLSAQSSWQDSRWIVSGTMGFGFGNNQTAVNISPQVGYRLTESFTVGGGPMYSFYRFRHSDTRLNFLGMNAFVRATPIPYIQFFVQPEVHRRWGKVLGVRQPDVVFTALLVGGGLWVPAAHGGIAVSLFYDVIGNRYSPYRRELMYSVGYSYYF